MSIKKVFAVAVAVSVVAGGLISCGGSKTQSSSSASALSSKKSDDPCIRAKDTGSPLDEEDCKEAIAERKREAERKQKEHEMAMAEAAKKPIIEGQSIVIPCISEALDKPGELRTLGISNPTRTQSQASHDVIGAAKSALALRFAGVLQSMVEDVVSTGASLEGTAFSEGTRDNAVRAIGEKVVDKFMENVCGPEILKDNFGRYIGYQVLRIPLNEKVVEEIASMEEVKNTRIQQQMTLNRMDKHLNAAREQQRLETEEVVRQQKELLGQ